MGLGSGPWMWRAGDNPSGLDQQGQVPFSQSPEVGGARALGTESGDSPCRPLPDPWRAPPPQRPCTARGHAGLYWPRSALQCCL